MRSRSWTRWGPRFYRTPPVASDTGAAYDAAIGIEREVIRMGEIRLVKPGDRTVPPGASTPGVNRELAFADDSRWVGYANTVPGVKSGWHHHGDHDTFIYVLRGSMELDYGPGGTTSVLAEAGDFVHVPAGTIHREGTPPGEPAEAVVVRVGRGPAVVAVEGPERG